MLTTGIAGEIHHALKSGNVNIHQYLASVPDHRQAFDQGRALRSLRRTPVVHGVVSDAYIIVALVPEGEPKAHENVGRREGCARPSLLRQQALAWRRRLGWVCPLGLWWS